MSAKRCPGFLNSLLLSNKDSPPVSFSDLLSGWEADLPLRLASCVPNVPHLENFLVFVKDLPVKTQSQPETLSGCFAEDSLLFFLA